MPDKLIDRIKGFSRGTVGVVGDVVADVYLAGTPARISREAPVLIIKQEESWVVPGSAANAAANLHELGARVRPFGVVGADERGEALVEYFRSREVDASGLIKVSGRETTTKTRILAGDLHTSKQQVVRLDNEAYGVEPRAKGVLLKALEEAAGKIDAWLVSDYGYGLVEREVLDFLLKQAREGKTVVGDSRYDLANFRGFTLAVPNEEEAAALAEADLSDHEELKNIGEELREEFGWKALLVTRGNRGMALFEDGRPPEFIPISGSSDIVDVSGAGDTVAAALTASLVAGASFLDAARIANAAAGVVVMKRGTATVSVRELKEALKPEDG